MSFDIGLWRSYAEASAEQEAAARALLAGRWQPVLRSALRGREGATFPKAVNFVATHPSKQFVDESVEVLARLASEGGVEWRAMVRLLETADPDVVSDVCDALACEAAADIAQVDYPRLSGLFSLLEQFGPRERIRELVDAASRSEDPDLRELAEETAADAGIPSAGATSVADRQVRGHPRLETAAAEEVPEESRALWERYAQAEQRLMLSRAALLGEDFEAVLVQALVDDDEAALTLLVHLINTWGGRRGDVPKRILDALAQANVAQRTMSALADHVVANPTSDEAFYAHVIDALGYVGLADLAERVREGAARSPFPRVRQVGE